MLEAALFTDLSGAEEAALDAVVQRFGRFMELPASVIKVSVEPGPRG